jgi:glycerol-3-phosphate dehydrogenase (NAD(P)+)
MPHLMSERSGQRIGILGAGAWGTAIGKVLAEKQLPVDIWSFEEQVSAEINNQNSNERYLPGVKLPPLLRASTDIMSVADNREHLLIAIPSLYLLPRDRKSVV